MENETADIYQDLKTKWVNGELTDHQYLMSVYELETTGEVNE